MTQQKKFSTVFVIGIVVIISILVGFTLSNCSAGSVSAAFPSPTPAGMRMITHAPLTRCTVTTGVPAGTVYVRAGPGMQYGAVDVVHEGEVLPLYDQPVRGWQKVATPQLVEGYIFMVRWCK